MEELTRKTDAELYERRGALTTEAEKPDADLDAIEEEVRAINAELEQRRAAREQAAAEEETRIAEEAKRAEMRKLVANGAGETIKSFTEERKTSMDIKEIRNTKAYIDAYAKGIMSGRYDECRKLLTENGVGQAAEGDGIVPVPTFVEERIQGIFERNDLLRRIRRTYFRGNLRVGFEVSSTGAAVHQEGDEAIADEEIVIGVAEIISVMIKKTILVTDELVDIGGQAMLDYIFDEFENKIEAFGAAGVVATIAGAPTTSDTSHVGVPQYPVSVITLDMVAQALALATNTLTDPCLLMNRGTYAAIRAAQLAANYAVDPFEGLPIVFTSALPAFADANDNDVFMIVGDLDAVTVNFPAGDQVRFVYDPYTQAPADLVRITGKLYAGIGLTTPGKLVNIVKDAE